jgi:hypothetical protein
MTSRMDVLMWATRINGKKTAPAHELLEIAPTAGLDVAQEAFHKIARMAHPDLHRTGLTADELETVTSAYATVANAYQNHRASIISSQRIRTVKADPAQPIPATSGAAVAATPSGLAPAVGAAGAMSARALLYYRKAELALKRGDLKGAVLQLKMAIAADPQSLFLRTALIEVETEVRKGP